MSSCDVFLLLEKEQNCQAVLQNGILANSSDALKACDPSPSRNKVAFWMHAFTGK